MDPIQGLDWFESFQITQYDEQAGFKRFRNTQYLDQAGMFKSPGSTKMF